MTKPIITEDVAKALARLMTVFGTPRTECLDGLIREYDASLKGVSADDLDFAIGSLIRSSKFFPRPAEIVAITDPRAIARRKAGDAKLQFDAEQAIRDKLAQRTPQEREAMRRLAREALSALTPPKPAVVVPNDVSAFETMRGESLNRHLHEPRHNRKVGS